MSRLFVGWCILACPVAWSQELPPDAPALTLPQAAAFALERNPRLRSAGFGREAAAAELEQAALTPPWSIDLQVEDVMGTGSVSGFGTAETTLRLSRIFQPSEVRAGRISIASVQGDQLENELDIERLDLMTLLARRFEAVVHRQDLLQLAEESVEVWQRARDLVSNRERAGAAPAVERLRTEIQLASARLQAEHAEHELRAARLSLAATWGEVKPTFGSANAELCRLPDLASFEAVSANLERNPDLLRFASDQRLEEARARLAEARRRPNWTLSAGVRRFEEIDDQALVFSMSVPFGSASRAEPAFRRANALRQRSELEEEVVRLHIHATLFDLYQEMLHARTAVQTFGREILPRAQKILADVEDGYRVGRFSHLELLNAQAELLAGRAARLTACSDYQRSLIDIERLTGGGSVWLANQPGATP